MLFSRMDTGLKLLVLSETAPKVPLLKMFKKRIDIIQQRPVSSQPVIIPSDSSPEYTFLLKKILNQ